MLEIEIKAYCDSCKDLIDKVVSLGGKLKDTREERDIYFNHPSRDFEQTDEAFRIRVIDKRNILTYKGPKLDERTKTRFEEEVAFDDFESMKTILLKLGFVLVDEVVKQRSIYVLNDIEICVDRVDGVGDFIELEKMGTDKERCEKELFELAERLGLDRFERRSYLELKLGGGVGWF